MVVRLTRIQVVVVSLVALVAVVAIVGTLSNPKPAAEQAAASPIGDVSASPSGSSSSPSPSPSSTLPPIPQTPKVLTSIDCSEGPAELSQPFVRDDRMYAICGNDVKVIDLASGEVVRTYKSIYSDPSREGISGDFAADQRRVIVDDGLWIDDTQDGVTKRVDLDSGRVTKTMNATLVGDWGGYVWLRLPGHSGLQGVDPASWALGPKLNLESPTYACGALWDWDGGLRTLRRFSLDGDLEWSYTALDLAGPDTEVSGIGVSQAGDECWAELDWATLDNEWSAQLVELSESCVTRRSPVLAGFLRQIGDTFWLGTWLRPDEMDSFQGQRLDLSTWQKRGPVWTFPSWSQVMAADGRVWALDGEKLQRLDVPLEAWPYKAASPLPCPSASALPTEAPTGS